MQGVLLKFHSDQDGVAKAPRHEALEVSRDS